MRLLLISLQKARDSCARLSPGFHFFVVKICPAFLVEKRWGWLLNIWQPERMFSFEIYIVVSWYEMANPRVKRILDGSFGGKDIWL